MRSIIKLLTLLAMVCSFSSALGQHFIAPGLHGSETWDDPDVPYVVQGSIWFENDDILSICEGVEVVVAANSRISMHDNSQLLIQGGPTEDCRVEIGSQGLWEGIFFDQRDNDPVVSKIHYCLISGAIIGIEIVDAQVDIRYNTFENCTLVGVHLLGGDEPVSVVGNIFRDIENNQDGQGVSAFNHAGNSLIENNQIFNNFGFGIRSFGSTIRIINNVIANNGFEGIYVENANQNTLIRNNIIIDNSIGIGLRNATPAIGYNDIWSNDNWGIYDWVNQQELQLNDGNLRIGNIAQNPNFVDYAEGAGGNDYHLDGGSPCINTGDPDNGYDDLTNGSRNDMGAFGGPENVYKVEAILGRSPLWWGSMSVNQNPDDYSIYYYFYTDVRVRNTIQNVDYTIGEGFRLRFDEDAKLYTNDDAVINAIGTSNHPLIFEGIDNADWTGIEIASEGIPPVTNKLIFCDISDADIAVYLGGSWLTINDCVIHGNLVGLEAFSLFKDLSVSRTEITGNLNVGVHCFGDPLAQLMMSDCEINGNGLGLSLSEQDFWIYQTDIRWNNFGGAELELSDGLFYQTNISENNEDLFQRSGVILFNSSPDFLRTRVENNVGYGITSIGGSDPVLSQTTSSGFNQVHNNGGWVGLRLAREEIWIDGNSSVELQQGHNNIWDDLNDVYISRALLQFPPIQAELNWWGPLGPLAANFAPAGLVDFNPWDPVQNFINSGKEILESELLYSKALEFMSSDKYPEAEELLAEILIEFPESRAAQYAPYRMIRCTTRSDGDYSRLHEKFKHIESISPRNKSNFNFQRACNRVLVKQDRYDEALRSLTEYMVGTSNFDHLLILSADIELVNQKRDGYPESMATLEPGRTRVSELANKLQNQKRSESVQKASQNPNLLIVKDIYPNPFNDQTRITFHQCVAGMLSVEIYNQLGQKIENIHSGNNLQGLHTF